MHTTLDLRLSHFETELIFHLTLFDVPLKGVARFIFLCKFDCLRGCDIACQHEHGGAVRGTNAASTSPDVKSTVERYGAPTLRRHRPPSRALWRPTLRRHCLLSRARWSSTGHQHRPPSRHGRAVRGTNAASTSPAVRSTVELYGAP